MKIFILLMSFIISTTFGMAQVVDLPDTAHQRAQIIPVYLQDNLKLQPLAYLDDLIQYLVADIDNKFLRVKIIHDWLALNIAFDPTIGISNLDDENLADIIKYQSSGARGYSNLFKLMCDKADIECISITGCTKGYGYNVFELPAGYFTNHYWNAVKINGKWYLVDVAWDGGQIENKEFTWHYSTDYLFILPRELIYTHFPRDSKWQLLSRAITFNEFTALPDYRARFFKNNIKLLSPLNLLNRVNDNTEIIFDTAGNIYAIASLQNEKGEILEQTHSSAILQSDKITVYISFPAPGNYYLNFLTKNKSSKQDDEYQIAARFGFIASASSSILYPVVYEKYYEQNIKLISDKENIWNANESANIVLTVPTEYMAIAFLYNDEGKKLNQNRAFIKHQADNIIVKVSFPEPGRYTLKLCTKHTRELGSGKYLTAVEFPLVASKSSKQLFTVLYDRFFINNIKLQGDPEKIWDVDSSAEIKLNISTGLDYRAYLYDAQEKRIDKHHLLAIRKGMEVIFKATFPVAGDYVLKVITNLTDKPGSFWDTVDIWFHAKEGSHEGFPYFYSRFYENGLEFSEEIDGFWNTGSGVTFTIKSPSDILPLVKLYDDKENDLASNCFVQRKNDYIYIFLTFPRQGDYLLKLYTKLKSDPEDAYYDIVAVFPFYARSGEKSTFPGIFKKFKTRNCFINQPLYNPLPRAQQVEFDIILPGVEKVSIKAGDEYFDLKKHGQDRFTGSIKTATEKLILVYWQGNIAHFLADWDVE